MLTKVKRGMGNRASYRTLAARLTASPMYQRLWRDMGPGNAIGRLMMQRVFSLWLHR